jgi:pilus assembly protein CpaB
MRGRVLILVGLLILLVAIIGFVVISGGGLNLGGGGGQVAPPPDNASEPVPTAGPTPTPIQFVRIVIALQNLPRGYRFPATTADLANVAAYAAWPEQAVPFNALREDQGGLERLLNKIARTGMFREQPILSNLVVDDLANLAGSGSDAAAVLPNDLVGVSVPIDRQTSVSYAIRPGDRVDVVLSMLFVDVDEVFQAITPNTVTLFTILEDGTLSLTSGIEGRPEQTAFGPAIIGPSERQRPRLVSNRAIQNALVVWVGDFPLIGNYIGIEPTPTPPPAAADNQDGTQGTPAPPTPVPVPNIVTLGVSPQNAVFLIWSIEAKLPLSLLLRSAGDASSTTTNPVSMDYVMQNYNINLPGRRDYAIEPAIRSIRQLLAGNEISLAQPQIAPPQ